MFHKYVRSSVLHRNQLELALIPTSHSSSTIQQVVVSIEVQVLVWVYDSNESAEAEEMMVTRLPIVFSTKSLYNIRTTIQYIAKETPSRYDYI